MSTYRELLRDPRWQRKRLEVMQRDGWKCCHCSNDRAELNVHHKEYRKGRKPWEYPDDILVTLCKPCHEAEHAPVHSIPLPDPKDFDGPIVGAVIPWVSFPEVCIRVDDPIGWSGKTIDYPDSERNSLYICCDGWGRELLVDVGCARGFLFPEGVKISQAIFFERINPLTAPKETMDWVRLIQRLTNEGEGNWEVSK